MIKIITQYVHVEFILQDTWLENLKKYGRNWKEVSLWYLHNIRNIRLQSCIIIRVF